MSLVNKQIHLVSRPTGEASVDNFALVESEVPPCPEGGALVRIKFLSLDPYMRGRMNEAKSYASCQQLNTTMIGGTVGDVIETKCAELAVGDHIVFMGGWQQYAAVANPSHVQKIDISRVPLSAYLGAVGMPGVTAWYGLNKIIAKDSGTVVVSAASGAVGSVVGQLAKARGLRVVGIAGGPDKCAYCVDELGFDACIDYKGKDAAALAAALREACPAGIDGVFENVGGIVLDAEMEVCNEFARIAVCGYIAGYNGAAVPLARPSMVLWKRLTMQGFIVSEHLEHWPAALAELGALVASGRLKYRESIADGIEAAPAAFIGLLAGRNFGKQLVRIAP